MNSTQRLREYVAVSLEPDSADLRKVSIKDAALNLGLSMVMVVVSGLHVVLASCQFVVRVMLAGYDVIAKGVTRAIPENNSKKAKA